MGHRLTDALRVPDDGAGGRVVSGKRPWESERPWES